MQKEKKTAVMLQVFTDLDTMQIAQTHNTIFLVNALISLTPVCEPYPHQSPLFNFFISFASVQLHCIHNY